MNAQGPELDIVRVLGGLGSVILHSAAVREWRPGEACRSVLVVGPTHSGKSTVAVAALVSGREAVADDSVAIANREARLQVVAVRRYLQLREPTLDLLPEVFRQRLTRIDLEDGQRWLLPREDPTQSPGATLFPDEMWFVNVAADLIQSVVEPVDQATALSLTVASTFGMGHEDGLRDLAPRLIPLLQQLVESCRTFRVRLGSVLLSDPVGELERILELTAGSGDAEG